MLNKIYTRNYIIKYINSLKDKVLSKYEIGEVNHILSKEKISDSIIKLVNDTLGLNNSYGFIDSIGENFRYKPSRKSLIISLKECGFTVDEVKKEVYIYLPSSEYKWIKLDKRDVVNFHAESKYSRMKLREKLKLSNKTNCPYLTDANFNDMKLYRIPFSTILSIEEGSNYLLEDKFGKYFSCIGEKLLLEIKEVRGEYFWRKN